MTLRGVLPPLVTPFHRDGTVDLPGFEGQLEALKRFDFAGFLVLGSNGEAASLEENEKLELVVAARRSLPGRFLLVGTGVESTGLKAAMDLAGLRGGEVRAPLLPVPDAVRDELHPLLERAGAAVA